MARRREQTVSPPAVSAPVAVVLSRDAGLRELVEGVIGGKSTENLGEVGAVCDLLGRSRAAVVVLDDEMLREEERGWLLGRIRRLAPDAFLIYVAGRQDDAVERLARSAGVLCYTARPVEEERLRRVLGALMEGPLRQVVSTALPSSGSSPTASR